jgi:S1-C subfamily serine protease
MIKRVPGEFRGYSLDLNFVDLLIKTSQLSEKVEDPVKEVIQLGLQSSCSIYVRSDSSKSQWSGSGFHVGNGLIVTAGHVIPNDANISDISISFDNQQFYPGRFIKSDPNIDAGVIYCEPVKSFPTLNLGDSDTLEKGDIIAVIGAPEGFHDTTTVGRISNLHQGLGKGAPSEAWNDIIFVDADIMEGSSGGMVIGTDGLVYGLVMGVTGQHADVGIGESSVSPSNKIRKMLSEIV